MHALTIQANYELRIDLEDFENSTAFAQYGAFGVGLFSVDPDDDGYPLTIADYSGTAGTAIPNCTVAIHYGLYTFVSYTQPLKAFINCTDLPIGQCPPLREGIEFLNIQLSGKSNSDICSPV